MLHQLKNISGEGIHTRIVELNTRVLPDRSFDKVGIQSRLLATFWKRKPILNYKEAENENQCIYGTLTLTDC
jgi:hypothetical protein